MSTKTTQKQDDVSPEMKQYLESKKKEREEEAGREKQRGGPNYNVYNNQTKKQ